MKRIALICSCVLLMAGTNPKISRSLASGAIGCAPQDITIINETQTRSIHNFTAICRGVEYFCSYMYPNPISCKARDMTPAEASAEQEQRSKDMGAWKTSTLQKALGTLKEPPDLTERLQCEIRAKVDERGRLLNLRWVKRCGVNAVDSSVVDAFKDAAPYGAPPDPVSALNGIVFSFEVGSSKDAAPPRSSASSAN